jgi:hypothetical protein
MLGPAPMTIPFGGHTSRWGHALSCSEAAANCKASAGAGQPRRLRDGSGVVHEDRYICRPVQRQDVGEFAEEVVTPPPLRLPMAPALIFASKICTVTLKQL